ncbi:MAG: hypothetical protein EAZ30_09100 [Betaproteobacteria bacterium]|nr:MAG: hypothetical protein EAZ30_09100 [Betaproteobacteria bacterium]
MCVFVGKDDQVHALASARREIGRQNWLPIGEIRSDILVERRIHDETNESLKIAYEEAKTGKIFFKYELDQLPMSTKGRLPFMKGPRVGEAFFDRVVNAAGGRRLTKLEIDDINGLNADYVFHDAVIELKDIQEEGLLVATRQEKLARFFAAIRAGSSYVSLSADDLSDSEWREYVDILGGPIQTQVKKAAQQLRRSREYFKSTRGVAIFLNSGYGSIPHDLFESIVKRYCTKDTKQIDTAICVSSWLVTNGFESSVNFAFTPDEEGCDITSALETSFWNEIGSWMLDWSQTGFSQHGETLQPVAPIAFTVAGIDFSTDPDILPSQLDE